ncbi:hypothetical protein [Paraburkholderia sp. J8-2]|uniref:hypothetical protein n=1 Tax=Paraburkholderia sp. J8-2 TaxID=2805440 RepID=UPI002AB628B8|nr:hypothetical protein [Paraburkholderia sp. J8-2]
MEANDLILSEREAASVVQILRAIDAQQVGRIELDVHSGTRIVYYTGGGTVAVYAPTNEVRIEGAGVVSADEDYFSVHDLASAYRVA